MVKIKDNNMKDIEFITPMIAIIYGDTAGGKTTFAYAVGTETIRPKNLWEFVKATSPDHLREEGPRVPRDTHTPRPRNGRRRVVEAGGRGLVFRARDLRPDQSQ